MRRLVWVAIALGAGILDGLFARVFGIEGLGFSLLIVVIAALFLSRQFSPAIWVGVGGAVIRSLITGRIIGWFALFIVLVIALISAVKYFASVSDKWVEWILAVVLLLGLYFFDLLVSRSFTLPKEEFVAALNFANIFWWVVFNALGMFVFSHFLAKLGKWVDEE